MLDSLLRRLVEVSDDRGPAIELDEPEPPRQALAEEKIVAVMQDGLREQLTALRLLFPQ